MSTEDVTRAHWRKSTRSNGTNNCVEVATFAHTFGVRDSKDKEGPFLSVATSDWASFLTAAKAASFDRP